MLHPFIRYQAHPLNVNGPLIEAPLTKVKIGELCEIYPNWQDQTVLARAQVLGFKGNTTLMSLIGSVEGLSRNMVISPTGRPFMLSLSASLAGSVLNPSGKVAEKIGSYAADTYPDEQRQINAPPPRYDERVGISDPFITGVRAIDGLITCGKGQRMGIFASAGCGKTTLMQMIINNADADIFVIALIGERGREVTEFVEEVKNSEQRDKCIIVYATSDFSALDRSNAALVAMTVAEYFRDQGLDVVFFLDSVTRYARALRDVALLAGEPPARRGYPASVFERLPALLERPGLTTSGSITAFFTILYEGDDESDPIAEEIRSILDGHIILSRKLAAKNHYPAIDVLKSISRVCNRVIGQEHLAVAGCLRQTLAKAEELQVLIDFGEYVPGQDPVNDAVFTCGQQINQLLCQELYDKTTLDTTLEYMHAIVS